MAAAFFSLLFCFLALAGEARPYSRGQDRIWSIKDVAHRRRHPSARSLVLPPARRSPPAAGAQGPEPPEPLFYPTVADWALASNASRMLELAEARAHRLAVPVAHCRQPPAPSAPAHPPPAPHIV